eukprot:scaffold4825_cov153-Amphora_coffeaeformis.AAC.4
MDNKTRESPEGDTEVANKSESGDVKEKDSQHEEDENQESSSAADEKEPSQPLALPPPLEAEMKDSKAARMIQNEMVVDSSGDKEVSNKNMKTKKDPAHHLAVEESPAALPPPLERTQARQISRVGATAVAGIGVSTTTTTTTNDADVDLPTAGPMDDDGDEELAAPPLVVYSSLGTVATNTSDPEVMATLVSDDEYEADLRRAIIRTSVKASKVETIPENSSTAASSKTYERMMCAGICFGVLMAIILVSVFVWLANNDDDKGQARIPEGLPPIAVDEDALVNFLMVRSFDGGEALQEYASPQRVALRYIAAEFPNVPMDEKLIDMYAVATFFFSTGGISWTNNTKWKSSDPVCVWHGISCDELGHVQAIELSNNTLAGVIPRELGMLAPRQVKQDGAWTMGLERLDLSHNRIQGTIPDQVDLLTSIEEFFVDHNGLWGEIPEGISQWGFLRAATFNDNSLKGEVPAHLCSPITINITVDCDYVNCSCCICDEERNSSDHA